MGCWGGENFYQFALNVQGWLDALGLKKKKIAFGLFRDHATRHGKAAGMTPKQYRKSAEQHIGGCAQRSVKVRHDGKTKLAHITKIGKDKYIFSSSNLSRTRIFTHMPEGVSLQYLRNSGITLPRSMM